MTLKKFTSILANPHKLINHGVKDYKTFIDRFRGFGYGSGVGLVLGGSVGSFIGGVLGAYKGDKAMKKESARARRDFMQKLGVYEEWKRIRPYQSYIIFAILAIVNIYTGGALSGVMGSYMSVFSSYVSLAVQAFNAYATYTLLQLRGVVGFDHTLDYAILQVPLSSRGEYLAGGSLRNACFAGGELHNKSGYLFDPNARAFGMPEQGNGVNSLYRVNFAYALNAGGEAYKSYLAGGAEFLVPSFLQQTKNQFTFKEGL